MYNISCTIYICILWYIYIYIIQYIYIYMTYISIYTWNIYLYIHEIYIDVYIYIYICILCIIWTPICSTWKSPASTDFPKAKIFSAAEVCSLRHDQWLGPRWHRLDDVFWGVFPRNGETYIGNLWFMVDILYWIYTYIHIYIYDITILTGDYDIS